MTQFMDNDVVSIHFGEEEDFIIEIEIFLRRTAPPSCFLVSDGDFFEGEIVYFVEVRDSVLNEAQCFVFVFYVAALCGDFYGFALDTLEMIDRSKQPLPLFENKPINNRSPKSKRGGNNHPPVAVHRHPHSLRSFRFFYFYGDGHGGMFYHSKISTIFSRTRFIFLVIASTGKFL